MTVIKPIKRSEQLSPLSREHHEGLLLAWKIRQGLKNRTDTEEIALYVHWFWNNHLQLHFSQEEHLLLPHLPESDVLAKQLIAEHQYVRELIAGQLNAASLAVLAGKMTDHIRFEERQLFPHIEQKLSSVELNTIHKQLDQQAHCLEKWGNKFWLKK